VAKGNKEKTKPRAARGETATSASSRASPANERTGAYPPKKHPAWLAGSIILFALWLLFLIYVAFGEWR
jgi:hypothetical protein